jgi:transitional endoplasmic reticulum ATPase
MAKNQAPAWGRELSERYNAGIVHAFLLHGNVGDYIGGQAGQTLRNYLLTSFGKREIVVYWNRANGFFFPKQIMKRRFAELCGLLQQATRPAPTGMTRGLGAAMQAAGGGGVDPLALIDQAGRQATAALGLIDQALRATLPEESPSAGRSGSSEAERHAPRLAVIIEYAESVVPQADIDSSPEDRQALVMFSEWGRDATIGQREHIVVLVASALNDVNERLRRSGARWEQLEIPFPSLEERREFAVALLNDPGTSLSAGFEIEELARMTTGLRYIDIEDIVLRAAYTKQPISAALVKARKDEIVRSEFEEVLQLLDHEYGFEAVGGMREVKADLMKNVVGPMRSGQLRRVPQGILFMGPAGTGKTRLARALAKEAGVTFVELQPSKIFSKWVGDTERRLERALTAIRMMTPCIVFIDEIDQAVGRGESGDSGVSNRVFKRLMEIMSDTTLRGKVLWICASNRPDLLDAALLRPGRLDKKIPILAPDAGERAAILAVLTRQAFSGSRLPSQEEYHALAAQMDGYTGAEIEAVIGKAVQIQGEHEWSVAQALTEAFDRIIPSTQDIERMTQLALAHCNDLDLVPSHLRDLARSVRRQAGQVQQEKPDDAQKPAIRRQREL